MPRHLHFAHMLPGSSTVKLGTKYEAGFQIGRVGKSGTAIAHCHFEMPKKFYNGYNQYPYYKGKQFVLDNYENPLVYLALPGVMKPMVFDHLGYGYVDPIAGYKNSFHPGVDLNNGAGDDDLGQPIWLPQRSTCIYSGTVSGWGLHNIFEVDAADVANPLIRRVNEALRAAGAPVIPKISEYYQQRVLNGDKRDFLDLMNAVKYRMVNNLYPHNG